jgi:alpha-N-acetylglucosamine transferase
MTENDKTLKKQSKQPNEERLEETLRAVLQQLTRMQRRIEALENTISNGRHTHSTTACLEDSLAVATDIILREVAQREETLARLQQLVKILQAGRTDPYSYDRGASAGPRPHSPIRGIK